MEHNVRKKWLRFIARPRFLPLHGDDEEFLQAPIEDGTGGMSMSKWADTVKGMVGKKNERDVELKAAEAVTVDGENIVEQGV